MSAESVSGIKISKSLTDEVSLVIIDKYGCSVEEGKPINFVSSPALEIVQCGNEHGFVDESGKQHWGAHKVTVSILDDEFEYNWFMSHFDFFKSVGFGNKLGLPSRSWVQFRYMAIKSMDIYCTSQELLGCPAGTSLADKFLYIAPELNCDSHFLYPDFQKIEVEGGILLSEMGKYNIISDSPIIRLALKNKENIDFHDLDFKIVMVTEDEFHGERTFEAEYISEK